MVVSPCAATVMGLFRGRLHYAAAWLRRAEERFHENGIRPFQATSLWEFLMTFEASLRPRPQPANNGLAKLAVVALPEKSAR